MSWLILVDNERDFSNADTPHKVMTTKDYVSRPQLFKDMKPKIVNLARSYAYQGLGYYCSLLAEARGHRIVPHVESMIELSRKGLYEHALPELEAMLNKSLDKVDDPYAEAFDLFVCFGQIDDKGLDRFSGLLFDWFRAPILEVQVSGPKQRRQIRRISTASVTSLEPEQRVFLRHALDEYTKRAWRPPKERVTSKFTLAVLYDPKERLPPSGAASIKHLAKVAERMDIDVEPIEKRDLDRLAEFDALFIRETTSIDNHTYRFARRAQQEGMPVIDDPNSMIRCTNKVYLAELMAANGIATPKTIIIENKKQAETLGAELGWPVVLKIPDGSFSRGVFKCDTQEALIDRIEDLLDDSDLLLAQEFVPTSFDWRIGVLDGEPLFACQYLMVKKHWQIVHHQENGKPIKEGTSKTFKIDEAPPLVIETAVKAARLIGHGFYGVDLKETDGRVVVIEINDNPNLDHGYEDAADKDVVWEKILLWFQKRLENR
jgi:glutathione synthase/RimK-type ligase-like ATP-grasp enzyme